MPSQSVRAEAFQFGRWFSNVLATVIPGMDGEAPTANAFVTATLYRKHLKSLYNLLAIVGAVTIALGVTEDWRSGHLFKASFPWEYTAIAQQTIPVLVALFGILTVVFARGQSRLTLLQMQQMEEARVESGELLDALSALTAELRRRPAVSHSVTFALFGAKN